MTKQRTFYNKIKKSIQRCIKNAIGHQDMYEYRRLTGVISYREVLDHLKSQFLPGMSESNYGNGKDKWSIDHIKPIKAFNLKDPEERKKCFHYTNLQPMWFIKNQVKGASYIDKERNIYYDEHGISVARSFLGFVLIKIKRKFNRIRKYLIRKPRYHIKAFLSQLKKKFNNLI